MKALTGSDIETAYNISGQDLFLGQDKDYSKKLTSNVVLYDQTKLNPVIMQEGIDTPQDAREEFITPNSTIRDLVGDNDDDATNDGQYSFFVNGVNSSGKSFQEKITMDTTNKVDELLTRIGQAYGNTTTNKVVDVSINEGRIEIEDLQRGSSKLDFHMFGSDENAIDDVDALVSSGAQIKEFVKSPIQSTPTMQSITAASDRLNPALHTIQSAFITQDGAAKALTPLSEVFPSPTEQINLSGTATDGTAVNLDLSTTGGESVDDLMAAIKNNFGDVEPFLNQDGKLEINDVSATGNFDLTLATQDAGGAAVTGIGNSVAAMQTKAFEVDGSYVRSNVPQIVTQTNEFPKDATKLSEVASEADIEGTSFDLKYTDVNGVQRQAQINYDAGGVNVEVDDDLDGAFDRNFDVLSHDGTITPPNEMTFKQLQDVVGMLVTNELPDGTNDLANYRQQVDDADARVDVYTDENGKFTIRDTTTTDTNIRFSMHDSNANDFANDAPKMSFSANNALVIDDVHVDFFGMLDEAIVAVENGFSRPDSENLGMSRSVGIQNLIEKLDHVHDHTVRKHTEIGAISQSFDYQISRNETLEVHTKTLRSEIIDTDFAEAAMNLQQLQFNYQAMALSIAKVQGLSLVNYL